MNRDRLFLASCIALIATAMSFAIRGDIMGEVQRELSLTDVQVGWILGAAFWGFGLSILFGGPLCDLLGMGTIMRLAAAGHILGALLTIASTNFTLFFLSTVVVGIANGLVEAAINPLIATLYSENKTAKLTTLHAWFPGGIVMAACWRSCSRRWGSAGTRRRSCCSCRRSSTCGCSSASSSRPPSGRLPASRSATCSRKYCGRSSS
jgi:MFS family permease